MDDGDFVLLLDDMGGGFGPTHYVVERYLAI